MKVIRVVTYEGSAERLTKQLQLSLRDGECSFINSVKITIETSYSDVDSEKFGEKRPEVPIEGDSQQ